MTANWLSQTGYVCETCGSQFEIDVNRFRCECGGVLNLAFDVGMLPRDLGSRDDDLARYCEALPWREDSTFVVDLGERRTTLIDLAQGTLAKCNFLLPTSSFKGHGRRS